MVCQTIRVQGNDERDKHRGKSVDGTGDEPCGHREGRGDGEPGVDVQGDRIASSITVSACSQRA